jgi:hypothetical protein
MIVAYKYKKKLCIFFPPLKKIFLHKKMVKQEVQHLHNLN